MVLARHEHATRGRLVDRVVGTAVPERQLEGLQPERAPEQLMAEADAVERPVLIDHRAHLGDVRVHRAGIARPVGEQHAVGRKRIDLGGGGVVGKHRHGGARLLEQPHDRGLGAVVEHDHVAARIGRRDARELARDLAGEQPPGHRRLRPQQLERLRPAHALTAGDGQHRAAIAQVAHERARVEARERHDPARAQPVEQTLAPVRRVVARLVADQRGGLHAARFGDIVLDPVVADHRRREGEDLTSEARIRERLLVAGHGGREYGLPHRRARGADAHPRPRRAVCEVQPDIAHAATPALARCAVRPPASVSRQRPCTSRPRNAQLRLREWRSPSLTV